MKTGPGNLLTLIIVDTFFPVGSQMGAGIGSVASHHHLASGPRFIITVSESDKSDPHLYKVFACRATSLMFAIFSSVPMIPSDNARG